MGWFNNKKEKNEEVQLPELPDIDSFSPPSMQELPSINSQNSEPSLPELPSQSNRPFPTTISHEINKNFEKSKYTPLNSNSKEIKPNFTSPRKIELSSRHMQPKTKKIEPVYIRLDKFQESLETFEQIKFKVGEIEDVLRKTKEIRAKEEQELDEWERELQLIKSQIDMIDRDIFNKIE